MCRPRIEALARQDDGCQRLMTVPGIGPIISSAVVAAIGNGAGFKQVRDFGAWLGLVPKQEGSTGDRTILGEDLQTRQQVPQDPVRPGRHVVLAARRPGDREAWSAAVDRQHRRPSIATCWRSRSPTSSPVSPGAFWPMGLSR